jgi:NAD(P)-dependent dehydrogenase (short-subunit alcohol dehydrogenase family)
MHKLNSYTKHTTAEDVTEGLDLSGKVALVTGCTNGIGTETMRVLARRGAHVLATGRTVVKVESASQGMQGHITPLALELTDLDSVNHCASTVNAMGLSPDIVILNAGRDHFGDLELVSGIEVVFFTNFLGHFVLMNNLLPSMLQKNRGRIVHVASNSAYKEHKGPPPEGIDFDNLRGEGHYNAPAAYGRSKLANALFAFELADRLAGTGLTSNAIHPGSVFSNIAHAASDEIRQSIKDYSPHLLTTAQGAATQVYVATSPDVEELSGVFFEVCNPIETTNLNFINDRAMGKKLWQVAGEMAKNHLV